MSKFAHFIILKHPFSPKQVAEIFIGRVVNKHGVPKSLIYDWNKILLSNFWKELFLALGTVLKRSTMFYPQTDGQMEREIGVWRHF